MYVQCRSDPAGRGYWLLLHRTGGVLYCLPGCSVVVPVYVLDKNISHFEQEERDVSLVQSDQVNTFMMPRTTARCPLASM